MEKDYEKFLALSSKLMQQLTKKEKTLHDFEWFLKMSDYEMRKTQNKTICFAKSLHEHFHNVHSYILSDLEEMGIINYTSKKREIVKTLGSNYVFKKNKINLLDALCLALDFMVSGGPFENRGLDVIIPFSLGHMKDKNKVNYLYIFKSSTWDRPKIEKGQMPEESFKKHYLKENYLIVT